MPSVANSSKRLACLTQIDDLLHRGIECGAIVDPWNILGFGGQFSLFPAVENSIPDPRVDELLELMEQIFGAQARLWHQAAASQEAQVLARLPGDFLKLVEWWDQFASEAVGGLRWVSGREAYAAAKKVADALSAWHKAGASGGDLNFWRPHVDDFDSPQAYAWVIDALLEKHDLSAAMALLVHWLGQADHVRLEEGPHSFHVLAMRWMQLALGGCSAGSSPCANTCEIASRSGCLQPGERRTIAVRPPLLRFSRSQCRELLGRSTIGIGHRPAARPR